MASCTCASTEWRSHCCDRDQIQLRGEHNVMNVLAAFAIGYAAGLPLDAMRSAAEDFRGVAHRLEFVREWNGAQWYNNSIATAPERTHGSHPFLY